MRDYFSIGEILKPQGIKGEVKVKLFTDDEDNLKSQREFIVDGEIKKVVSSKIVGGFLYVVFRGYPDRNSVEFLRGKKLYIERNNASPLEEDTYYIQDVLECVLCDEEENVIGEIIDITPANKDIYTIKQGDKIFRFPLLKTLLVKIDLVNKKVVVLKEELKKVSVYED